MKVSCICKELVAHNLELYCKNRQSASMIVKVREHNLLLVLSKTIDRDIYDKKKHCDDDDIKVFSKKSKFCDSEITIHHSVLKKADCCDTEKKSNCCDTMRKSNCFNEILADCYNSKKKLDSFHFKKKTSVFNKFNKQIADHFNIKKDALLLEHVVLNIQKLMCIDCIIKLFRSLQSILKIHNLCISLVLFQVKFNLDEKFSLIVKVIKSVKKTTDFICQQLNNEK